MDKHFFLVYVFRQKRQPRILKRQISRGGDSGGHWYRCSNSTAYFSPLQASPSWLLLKNIYHAWQKACTDETPADVISSNFAEHINTVGFISALWTDLMTNIQTVWLLGGPSISRNTICVVSYSRGIKSTNKISNGPSRECMLVVGRGKWLLYLNMIWALYCVSGVV